MLQNLNKIEKNKDVLLIYNTMSQKAKTRKRVRVFL